MLNRINCYARPSALLLTLLLCLIASSEAYAQAAAFTYQGRLTDNGNPADGIFDMQFKLFDTADVGTGTQQGSTMTKPTVQVTNGVFVVDLDFGAGVFDGSARFLEIGLRPAGSPDPYTILSPRQPITSTPYAIRSSVSTAADGLSVACVNCVTSSQIQSVAGSQVSGAIPVESVPAGSGNYIQNTTIQQPSSNFNISGNGTAGGTLSAGIVNAATQYDIGGNRVLSTTGTENVFLGVNAGIAITFGNSNTFVGHGAGQSNTLGFNNSFFGAFAGSANTIAISNSFFGASAGLSNTRGSGNSYFGTSAGQSNQIGEDNSFFGNNAGFNNITSENSFFGSFAGQNTSIGSGNSFFGAEAGRSNQTGSTNSFFGVRAGFSTTSGGSNSFFGANAGRNNTAGTQNSYFGAIAGFQNQTGNRNSFFGDGAGVQNLANSNSFFGSGTGAANTLGSDNSFFGVEAGLANSSGNQNSFFGTGAGRRNRTGGNNTFIGLVAAFENVNGSNNTVIGAAADVGSDNLSFATAIGSGAVVPTSNTVALGRSADRVYIPGNLDVSGFVTIGSLAQEGTINLCLNALGQISNCEQSLKGNRDSAVTLMNAIKEQQAEIAERDEQIKALQQQNAAFEARIKALEERLLADKSRRVRSPR